jgi:E3 ubiquitin-protein ligase TRIP12
MTDEDVAMLDSTIVKPDEPAYEEHPDGCNDDDIAMDDQDNGGDGEGDDNGDEEGSLPVGATRGFAGLDESAAMAIFGDYRQFGSYMVSLSSRLKTMLNNIKSTASPTTRLVTLQELSELLSISTEDTLAGSFQVEQFVRELVKILGGRGADEDEDDEGGDDGDDHDEDAALAAALAMSGGGTYQGDENLEAQMLACRCLANLMEALPGVAHSVVYHGAIPVLCSKLIEISYIDLAEQTLSTLEKISEEFPSSIVRENGLAALLNYLDFFSIAVQRTALQAAANCCRNISPDHFQMILGVWPIIRNCIGYSDQRLVEFACLCVIRVLDSYHRSATENLENLLDETAIRAINLLLMPAGGSPLIAANTFTLLLKALATAARASPKITLNLLQADIVDTLYQILTGVLPSASGGGGEQGGQGLAGDVTHMTVMENLAHRSKEQVEEALSLVSELMPPLPKDGVFDHKGYTDKALTRMVKAKAKADRAAARQAVFASYQPSPDTSAQATPAAEPFQDTSLNDFQMQDPDDMPPLTSTAEPAVADRTELLRSKPEVVGRFMQLIVPILIDVYAASVITPVRVKTLTGLLKAVGFLEGEALKDAFNLVPVASFASSILSSKDHPSLVIGALQLVDLLLQKLPAEYRPVLRREGVFHEIESLAARTLTSIKSKDSDGTIVSDPVNIPIHISSTIPGYKKLHSLSLEPEDAITLRARVIRFKYSLGQEEGDEDNAFDELRRLVDRLASPDVGESAMISALRDIADHFTSHSSVSSFELLQSGAVDGLLRFATNVTRSTVTSKRRQELLYDSFSRIPRGGTVTQSPLAVLVKKLQESLTRMEDFDVVTVSQGTDDSKRSSPSLLARQLRLRLVADNESDIPRNLQNMVVSIHAIATFQALNDYLRPRITGLMSTGGLSGMLAALAASGFGPASSRNPPEAPIQASKPAESSSATKSASETPVAGSSEIGRRRSLRLSAKNGGPSGDKSEGSSATATTIGSVHNGSSSSVAPQSTAQRMEALIQDGGLISDFTDDEVDAEVFEDDDDIDSAADKTVTLSIADDGSKVEAQTPDGTRVATPSTAPLISSSRPPNANKTSYAAALKAKPSDWHLEFSMDDHLLPLDLTIYGAIHQHEIRKKLGPVPSSSMWQGIYTVKFKKVNGPPPSQESRADTSASKIRSPSPILSSLPDDAPHAKILRLLRVLHRLNAAEAQRPARPLDRRALSETTFINNKLTAKLTRQLEEPMIVVSSCLPDWALDLPQNFPFLFPFATRYNYLQSTSFGYARLILKWQSQQGRSQDSSRRDEGIGFLGRLQRQKVRISRKHILESAVKVFELYGSSSSILEVEYFDEVGTGLGPTLEFYSLVSKEFARRDLKIWRDADSATPGMYVHHPTGLYPAPISPDDIANDGGQKRTHILRVVGQYVAKAMLDSRIIDLSVNKVFVKLILGEEVPLTIESLKLVDNELASSLSKLQSYASMKGQSEKLFRKVALMDIVNVEDLALDFTVPGYDIELRPGGRNIPVTSENAEEYIHEVLDAIIGAGVQPQARAFREGFSKVFPISDLQAFSADELVMLFGNSDEDWGVETLNEAIKADHGFHSESRAIRELIGIMSDFDPFARRDFLQFITGSPKLPIGGFRGLNPPLTVVRKPHEPPLMADDYLPSVMTCVNYLKLPEYSSKVVMREKLRIAMKEGVGSFHLS